MSTDALKKELINQIAGITDRGQLEEVWNLLQFHEQSAVYITSKEQKAAIQDGLNQIAAGAYTTDEEVYKEIGEWLKK